MTGYIYICTCITTNKSYIGQTRQSFSKRKNEHLRHYNNKNYPNYNCKFYRALRKYSKENFYWSVLKIVESTTIKNLIDELNYWEIYYIDKFNSYKNGYNMTFGGDTSKKIYKKINVYDKNGVFIKTFDNIVEASNEYNICKSTIWSNCNRVSTFVKWNNTRLIFRWADNGICDSDLNRLISVNYQKEISMYSIDGVKLGTFSSSKEISQKFNISCSKVTKNCRRLISFVQINSDKYIFRYIDDTITEEDLAKARNVKSMPKVSVIAIDSITNEIIGEFVTQKEAGRILGVIAHNISEVCSGKRKSAGKYNNHPIIWKRKPIL